MCNSLKTTLMVQHTKITELNNIIQALDKVVKCQSVKIENQREVLERTNTTMTSSASHSRMSSALLPPSPKRSTSQWWYNTVLSASNTRSSLRMFRLIVRPRMVRRYHSRLLLLLTYHTCRHMSTAGEMEGSNREIPLLGNYFGE